jgi:hypothetical protein
MSIVEEFGGIGTFSFFVAVNRHLGGHFNRGHFRNEFVVGVVSFSNSILDNFH